MQDDSFTNTHAWLGVPVAVGSAHVSQSYCHVHGTGVAINRTLPPPQDCPEVTLRLTGHQIPIATFTGLTLPPPQDCPEVTLCGWQDI